MRCFDVLGYISMYFACIAIERNMEGIERLKEDRAFQMQDLGSHRVLHRTAQASLNGGAN